MNPPWKIYQEELFRLGYGLPLWHPEPNVRGDGPPVPIEIGTVGWMNEGGITVLFNSMKPDYHPPDRLPRDFTILDGVATNSCSKIHQEVVVSHSVKATTIEGQVAAGPGAVSVGTGFKYSLHQEKGAAVELRPPGMQNRIDSKGRIKEYMKHNLEQWLELANGRGLQLDLREEDIVFISGVITTTKWTVIALQGPTSQQMDFSVGADASTIANAALNVSMSDSLRPLVHHRRGPDSEYTGNSLVVPGNPQVGTSNPATESNQCLFVRYYKMKRRLWFLRTIEASAGPHQLPPGEDGHNPEFEFAEATAAEGAGPYDPVNYLLDHILRHCEDALVAFGSDIDLMACFPDGILPDDIRAGLEDIMPEINVDADGVATVVAPYTFSIEKRPYEEVDAYDNQHVKRPRLDDDSLHGEYMNEDWETGNRQPPYDPSQTGMFTGQGHGYDESYDDEDGPSEEEEAEQERFGSEDPGPEKEKAKRIATATHEGSITALTYSPNGEFVASGSDDCKIIIWGVTDRGSICTMETHEDPISALAFSHDSQILASASQATEIILWNVQTWQELKRLTPTSPVQSLAFTPSGELLIAGTSEGKLEMWTTEEYTALPPATNNTAAMTFMVFSPDGSKMATGGIEKDCVVWDVASLQGTSSARTIGDGRNVYAAAFSPFGDRIVTSFDDGSCTVWNANTGDALVIIHEHTGPVWAVAFSPDGKQIASGSDDGTVKVVDSYTGTTALELTEHNGTVNAVAFSPDGRFLASAATDKLVLLWDAYTGERLFKYNEHDDDVTQMMFSPNGRSIASGSLDGGVYVRPVVTVPTGSYQ